MMVNQFSIDNGCVYTIALKHKDIWLGLAPTSKTKEQFQLIAWKRIAKC